MIPDALPIIGTGICVALLWFASARWQQRRDLKQLRASREHFFTFHRAQQRNHDLDYDAHFGGGK